MALPPTVTGLSPLARGNRMGAHRTRKDWGPIPARTGQPQIGAIAIGLRKAYPRSHGATSRVGRVLLDWMGLSPLARGNLSSQFAGAVATGPIPARTGQPGTALYRAIVKRAYPRSHGATLNNTHCLIIFSGLSPLARGNLRASW